MYDILIPTAKKDFLKFRFVYDSIVENLDGFDTFYCISNVEMPRNLVIPGVRYFLDDDVLDFDYSEFQGIVKERKRWYIQQFVKLFQQVTSDDYLVVDADVYFNKKIAVFENGKPTFLFGKDQSHQPYFDFTKRVLGFGRVYPYSFINEVMLFKRKIINHMVSSTGFNLYGFFELIVHALNKINDTSGMCEYEMYGNYVTKYFKDQYNYRYLKTKRYTKRRIWTVEELQNCIDSIKGTNYDMVTFHSWM